MHEVDVKCGTGIVSPCLLSRLAATICLLCRDWAAGSCIKLAGVGTMTSGNRCTHRNAVLYYCCMLLFNTDTTENSPTIQSFYSYYIPH